MRDMDGRFVCGVRIRVELAKSNSRSAPQTTPLAYLYLTPSLFYLLAALVREEEEEEEEEEGATTAGGHLPHATAVVGAPLIVGERAGEFVCIVTPPCVVHWHDL